MTSAEFLESLNHVDPDVLASGPLDEGALVIDATMVLGDLRGPDLALYRKAVAKGLGVMSSSERDKFTKGLMAVAKAKGMKVKQVVDHIVSKLKPKAQKTKTSHYLNFKEELEGIELAEDGLPTEAGLVKYLNKGSVLFPRSKGQISVSQMAYAFRGTTTAQAAKFLKGMVKKGVLSVQGKSTMKGNVGSSMYVLAEGLDTELVEKSPPGWAGTVKAMKKHMPDDKAFALAWSGYKKGHEPHYKSQKSSKEGTPVKKKKFQDEGMGGLAGMLAGALDEGHCDCDEDTEAEDICQACQDEVTERMSMTQVGKVLGKEWQHAMGTPAGEPSGAISAQGVKDSIDAKMSVVAHPGKNLIIINGFRRFRPRNKAAMDAARKAPKVMEDVDSMFEAALEESVALPADILAISNYIDSKEGKVSAAGLKAKFGMTDKWIKKLLVVAKQAFRGAGVPRAEMRRREADPRRWFREKVQPILVDMRPDFDKIRKARGAKSMGEEELFEEAPYTDETAEAFAADIKKGLKGLGVPVIEVTVSRLGGKGRHTVMLRMSLDAKADWPNKIYQNSRYAMFSFGADGKMELFSRHYKLPKFRKSKYADAKKAMAKIKQWLDKANKVEESLEESSTDRPVSGGISLDDIGTDAGFSRAIDMGGNENLGVEQRLDRVLAAAKITDGKPQSNKTARPALQAAPLSGRRIKPTKYTAEDGEDIDDLDFETRLRMAEAYDMMITSGPDLSKEQAVDAEHYLALVTKTIKHSKGVSLSPAEVSVRQVAEEEGIDLDELCEKAELDSKERKRLERIIYKSFKRVGDAVLRGDKHIIHLAKEGSKNIPLEDASDAELQRLAKEYAERKSVQVTARRGGGSRRIPAAENMDEMFEDAAAMLMEAGAHYFDGKSYHVDTAFLNATKGVLSGMSLDHLGFGEFSLKGKDGEIEFDRMRGEPFEGQSGRSHKMYDNKKGALVKKLIAAMEKKGKSKLVKEAVELDEAKAKASYDFGDVGSLIDDWKRKYDSAPSGTRLSRQPYRAVVHKLVDAYNDARAQSEVLVSKADATTIKKTMAQLLKDTGKYGGAPAKIASEKTLLKDIIAEIKFAMKHPEPVKEAVELDEGQNIKGFAGELTEALVA